MTRASPPSARLAASALLGALLLGGLAACQTSRPSGVVTSAGFPAPDQEIVYHSALRALGEQGFSADLELSDAAAGTIVTRWKNSLQPFSGQGYRDQATVTIRPVAGRSGYYAVDTQVIRQFNDNMVQPSNLVTAEWKRDTRVSELEMLISRRIETYFLPGGLSSDFRQRHGLAPTPR